MISWLSPADCDPPHRVTHPGKALELYKNFCAAGWDLDHPALIGYHFGDRIQLISGSHRHAAAAAARILLPVVLYRYSDIQAIWGTDAWLTLVKNTTPTKDHAFRTT